MEPLGSTVPSDNITVEDMCTSNGTDYELACMAQIQHIRTICVHK